jgi:hypothetical protein
MSIKSVAFSAASHPTDQQTVALRSASEFKPTGLSSRESNVRRDVALQFLSKGARGLEPASACSARQETISKPGEAAVGR